MPPSSYEDNPAPERGVRMAGADMPEAHAMDAAIPPPPSRPVPSRREESTPIATADSRSTPLWMLFVLYVAGVVALGISQRGTMDQEMGHDTAHYLSLARSVARGDAFSTQTHWALNMPGDGLPRPDTYRAPLFPILVAAASRIVPDYHLAGKWVTVLCGAGIPLLVFLFARRRLGLTVRWSLLAAAIALTHHHLVLAGSRALTEAPYTLITLALLYVITARRPFVLGAGVLVGLACLTRYQGLVLVPVGIGALWIAADSWPRRFTSTVLFAVTLAVTVAPWAARTYEVTGSPFYSDLKYHLVASYDPEVTYYEYFHSTESPREPVGYMTERLDHTMAVVADRLRQVTRFFWRENAGNPLFLACAVLGLLIAFTRRRGSEDGVRLPLQHRTAVVIVLFILANIAVVALTFAKSRHLTSLDPLIAVYAAFGASMIIGQLARRDHRWMGTGLVVLLFLGMAVEQARAFRKLSRFEPTGYAQAERLAPYLRENLGVGESIMAASPYYFSYLLDRQAVSLPWCDDALLADLVDRFDVRFVFDAPKNAEIPSLCEESALRREPLPPWLRFVRDEAPGRLLLVDGVAVGTFDETATNP
jgi:hypothetical protein